MLYPAGVQTRTPLQEIFEEADRPCTSEKCSCRHCQSLQRDNGLIRELGWAQNEEEEQELSMAFQKIKDFAHKSYNKAKPVIAAADIIRRLIFPSTEPVPVQKDIAAYIEQDKKRQRQERIDQAQLPGKVPAGQRPPESEVVLIQEIFAEAEQEWNDREFLMGEDDWNENTKNARPSTEERHQYGMARKKRDRGGEKGDVSRRLPRKRPNNWIGPWPPRR